MRKLRTILITMAMILTGATGVVLGATEPVSAAGPPRCSKGAPRLLTFPAWYDGLVKDNCDIKPIGNGPNDLRNFIMRIGLNVVEIILQLVAYATVVFLILGGFNYMTAAGDSSKITGAKHTIERALIGLVISLASVGIVNLIAGAL